MTFNKIISVILSVVMVFSILPLNTFVVNAATSGTTGDCTWLLEDGILTISGNGEMGDYKAYDDLPWNNDITDVIISDGVTSIGEFSFQFCESLTFITIPDSVTHIGRGAFYSCSSLKDIILPDSITSIDDFAFMYCVSITEITLPNSITEISNGLFEGCGGLTSITLPDSITSIEHRAFYFCNSLTSITIPDSVTNIGDRAFYSCSSLSSISIPNSVTSIGVSAFYDCDSLIEVIIPDNVTLISGGMFYDCNLLQYIIIPNSVTTISSEAFYSCTSLSNVTIPNSVTTIGNKAFSCSSLSSINIPNSVTKIGDNVFQCCYSLTSITVENGNTAYSSSGNCLIETKSKTLIFGCENSVIPTDGSVEIIGNSAFWYCANLTSISIPNSVTAIEAFAFRGCSSLTSIVIPKSVTNIGWYAFFDCSSLTTFAFGSNITYIGESTFYNCTSLKNIYYCGSEEEWNQLDIDFYNEALTNATRYYHDFGEWQTRIQVTDCLDGEEYRTCSFCDKEETQIKSAKGHSYNNGICTFCNSFIESKHNYLENTDETYVISKENTASITITFSADTLVEKDWDFIYIYDATDNEIGKYTGSELASKSVTVEGNTAKIRLVTDRINNAYGFKVTDIVFACAHDYNVETQNTSCLENGYTKYTCKYCGDIYYTYEAGIHIYENGNCIYCNSLLESEHDYATEYDKTWEIYRKGATSITLTFSAETFVEENYDFIYIYNADDNEIGKYTGDELAAQSVNISGDTVKIRLESDRLNTAYGFKLTDITTEYISGDLNGDGEVDIRDLVRLKKTLAGSTENNAASPDIDNSGDTTAIDLTFLRKFLLGIIADLKSISV